MEGIIPPVKNLLIKPHVILNNFLLNNLLFLDLYLISSDSVNNFSIKNRPHTVRFFSLQRKEETSYVEVSKIVLRGEGKFSCLLWLVGFVSQETEQALYGNLIETIGTLWEIIDNI